MNTQRQPQLALRLDAALPDPAERWHEGTSIAFLGGRVTLTLDTAGKDALLDGEILHLPLPPQATPRQIRDRAEAWLREAAKRWLTEIIAQKSALAGRRPPQLMLSFAAQGHWVEIRSADALRCNWRLIEQPMTVIEQVIARAIAAMPRYSDPAQEPDLFGVACAA
jgi:predicted metal-dependent hydrolase